MTSTVPVTVVVRFVGVVAVMLADVAANVFKKSTFRLNMFLGVSVIVMLKAIVVINVLGAAIVIFKINVVDDFLAINFLVYASMGSAMLT